MSATEAPSLTPDVIRALARATMGISMAQQHSEGAASPPSPPPPPLVPCRRLAAPQAVGEPKTTPQSGGRASTRTPRLNTRPTPRGIPRASSARQLSRERRKALLQSAAPKTDTPRRVASAGLFDRLHRGAEHKEERRQRNLEIALHEELATLRPPRLSVRSRKMADRIRTQPLYERSMELQRTRNLTLEQA
mmetsp:Transcript_67780/g.157349  ORF Transcript_67780/g.157349 Transcript_67780/m.157349 type:complete len:192 (+) Transcript_67780:130-705(+)